MTLRYLSAVSFSSARLIKVCGRRRCLHLASGAARPFSASSVSDDNRGTGSSSGAIAASTAASTTAAATAHDLPIPEWEDQKVLHVAVAGLPNAGKSTLLNYMVGDKVSAVSTKRHTTRENTLGVMTVKNAQVFFHDTPGFVSHEEGDDYKPALSAASREAIELVNLTLLLVDASKDVTKRGLSSLNGLLEKAIQSRCEVFLILNKVDIVKPKHRLMTTTDEIMERAQNIMDRLDKQREDTASAAAEGKNAATRSNLKKHNARESAGGENNYTVKETPTLFRDGGKTVDDYITVFMISAATGDGVEDIVEFLVNRAQPGNWLFGRDETTNKDKRSRVQEIVREGLFTHLYKELPYQIKTHLRELSTRPDGSISMLQDLRVERSSQKKIVIGKLRFIRKDVEWNLRKLFGARVDVRFSVLGGHKR